jgi:hypothetical protein
MPECPERETLEQFLAGALDDRAEDDLCAHVEECSACQRTLDDMVAGSSPYPGASKGATAGTLELDSSFLKRLQQTVTNPDWRPPPLDRIGPTPRSVRRLGWTDSARGDGLGPGL